MTTYQYQDQDMDPAIAARKVNDPTLTRALAELEAGRISIWDAKEAILVWCAALLEARAGVELLAHPAHMHVTDKGIVFEVPDDVECPFCRIAAAHKQED